MADEPISGLTEVTTPLSSDMLAIVNGGVTKKVTIQNAVNVAVTQGDWDFTKIKSVDQDVVGTAFTNDTELFRATLAGEAWYFEFLLLQETSSAGSYNVKFTFPLYTGFAHNLYCPSSSTTSDSMERLNNVATTTSLATVGHSTLQVVEFIRVQLFLAPNVTTTVNGTVNMAFNNGSAGATSRTKAGSIMRGRRLGTYT